MRAFVAGATGYTGREVVAQLVRDGHDVTAHIRPDSSRLRYWQDYFSEMGASTDSTPWQAVDMATCLERLQPNVVFGLLGTTAARKKGATADGSDGLAETYEHVDFGLTAMLLAAAESCGSKPRFVYLSSIGVRRGGPGAYLLARWKVEELLRISHLPWTVARPAIITGDGRDERRLGERVSATVGDACLRGLAALGRPGPEKRYASMGSAELAAGLVHYSQDESAVGQAIDAARLRAAGTS